VSLQLSQTAASTQLSMLLTTMNLKMDLICFLVVLSVVALFVVFLGFSNSKRKLDFPFVWQFWLGEAYGSRVVFLLNVRNLLDIPNTLFIDKNWKKNLSLHSNLTFTRVKMFFNA
jgi:uncharacterized membrane protein